MGFLISEWKRKNKEAAAACVERTYEEKMLLRIALEGLHIPMCEAAVDGLCWQSLLRVTNEAKKEAVRLYAKSPYR